MFKKLTTGISPKLLKRFLVKIFKVKGVIMMIVVDI